MGNRLRQRIGLWLGLLILVAGVFALYKGSSAARAGELVVDHGRLRTHLTQLATERYTDLALARTRAYLTEQLRSYGYEPIFQPFGEGKSAGINLSVIRPGNQDPEHKILVGAHYDSVAGSPGADDNASAVAAALEVARIFASYPTEKTLQVVFFDQEEAQPSGGGLVGSNAFVRDSSQLEGLESAVILEMLGYACYESGCQSYPPGLEKQGFPTQGDFIGVIGDADHPEFLSVFETNGESESTTPPDAALKAVTLLVPVESLPLMPDLFRSDHVPFWLKGMGAVMVSDTANFRNPHYHQSSDTVENLDLRFLEQSTQYVVERMARLLGVS